MRTTFNLPEGNHEAVLRGEPHKEMVAAWANLADQHERMILETYGVGHFPMAETVRIVAYASISRTAFALCSAADIAEGHFDPVEFGKRCEKIAREQVARYRTSVKSERAA